MAPSNPALAAPSDELARASALDASAPPPLSLARRRAATAALLFGMFAAAIEMTIVGTAMPRIAGALGGSDRFTWVLSIYLLTLTVAAPLTGKLADQLGRKPVYLGAMSLFLAGSALCGAAPSMNALIAARALQGVGGGALNTAALTLIGDLYAPHERGRVQAWLSAVWGTAGALGPVLGGLVVDRLGWRWVFYLNLPFGAAAIALLSLSLRERVTRKPGALDLAGTALLTLGVLALQLAGGAGHGAPHAASRALPPWAAIAAAAGFFTAFFFVERRAKAPLVPLELLRDRLVGTTLLLCLASGSMMFATTNFVPLYVQGVLGATAQQAGAVLTPFSLGWPLAGVVAGSLLTRGEPRRFVRAGVALAALGALAPLFASALPARAVLLLAGGLLGAGMGLAQTVLLVALQSAVPWAQRGTATAAFAFCRSLGGALGIVLAGAVYGAGLAAQGVAPASIDAALRPGAALAAPALREALAAAVRGAFWSSALTGLATLAVVAAYPRVAGLARPRESVVAAEH